MQNVKEQTFDRVHDTQFIYRQLLDAMARPGQVNSIVTSSAKLMSITPLQAMVTCFAWTLLDGEVSFSIEMDDKDSLETYVRKQTFSRIQHVSEADYIIANGNKDESHIRTLLSEIKRGTLPRPEGGATLFIQVDGFGPDDSMKGCWTFTGPGIQDTRTLCVQGLSNVWINERARVNAEYPMGVDIVLFTESGQITSLPRTTIIRGEGV